MDESGAKHLRCDVEEAKEPDETDIRLDTETLTSSAVDVDAHIKNYG
jgi:hypothetical protein